MNDGRHVVEELSAYLDGEAEGAVQVEAHLRVCPVCAQRYHELRAVAVQVRKLRAPEVHPEFVTRVLTRVRDEANDEARVPWWAQWFRPAPVLAFSAVAAVLVGLVAYRALDTGAAAPQETSDSIAQATPGSPETDAAPETVRDLSQAGVDLTQLADALDAEDGSLGSADVALDGSSANDIDSAFMALLDAGWSSRGDDAFGVIEELSPDEQAEVQQLLQRGNARGNTNEG